MKARNLGEGSRSTHRSKWLSHPAGSVWIVGADSSNSCIHCKTCDIKAPAQDIKWQTPQGGEGPVSGPASLPADSQGSLSCTQAY